MRQKIMFHFSAYNGEEDFIFQGKIFYKHNKKLGEGGYGVVYRFEADDHTQLAVKSELPDLEKYSHGKYFQNEALWYQQIYGLGVLSGDPNNYEHPHYVLMPYFEGKTLYESIYPTLKTVISYWIKSAYAVQQLHEKHLGVHCDLKSDNIIIGNCVDQAFIIDFGFTTPINEKRNFYIENTHRNKKSYRQYAPEVFTSHEGNRRAHPLQDVYSLGILLCDLHALFLAKQQCSDSPLNMVVTMNDVKMNLIMEDPRRRWPIAKAIYILASSFFSQIPRQVWTNVMSERELYKLKHTHLMIEMWHIISKVAIQVRRRELEHENKERKSERKDQKINGLNLLLFKTRKISPVEFNQVVSDTKMKFPQLTAGIFSKRTETLLNELGSVAPVFH
jgi:serine/threonine protein kinase